MSGYNGEISSAGRQVEELITDLQLQRRQGTAPPA